MSTIWPAYQNWHIYRQTSNTQTVGNYLDYDADALNNWFPKNAVLLRQDGVRGCRTGRAISPSAPELPPLRPAASAPLLDAVDDLFTRAVGDKQAMRAVIISTATPAVTGSGILLPLAMYLRDYVKDKY